MEKNIICKLPHQNNLTSKVQNNYGKECLKWSQHQPNFKQFQGI